MKSALLIRGGWQGHEPKECMDIVAPVLESEGYSIEISDSLETFSDRNKIMSSDVIVLSWTHGLLTAEQEKILLDAVAGGVGIAGWHGGMADAFRSNSDYHFMIGGQFAGHPGDIIDYEVNIVRADDPVMAGIADFKMHSEQFFLLVDPGNTVLATTTFDGRPYPWIEGRVMPVVWKRQWGKGKVFYSSLGHNAKDFQVPQVLEILKRGILWASR